MKISNSYHLSSNPNKKMLNNKPNFKGISPTAIKNVTTNPATKNLFIKLASVAGLTSIIAWVNSLKEGKKEEALEKLDIIDSVWTEKGNNYFLNPESQENFLNLVSKADSAESLIWTKGLLSETKANEKENIVSEEETAHFINPTSNEMFLKVSAEIKLKTILNQIKALSGASEEVKNTTLKAIETNLNSLIKQANALKESEATAEIYEKIANIVKMFALTNLINKPAETKPEKITTKEEIPAENNPTISENTAETPVDYSAREEAKLPGIKILGKIDLPESYKSNPKIRKSENEEELKPIQMNDSNREFFGNLFLPTFKESSINPEIYSDYIDLIKEIYDSYENEKVKQNLLTLLKENDYRKTLKLYSELTTVKDDKIGFVNFSRLEQLKNENGGSLTKEEFDKLSEYINKDVKFFQIINEEQERFSNKKSQAVRLDFVPGVDVTTKFRAIMDFHKVAFHIPEDFIIDYSETDNLSIESIKNELFKKLHKNIDEYPGILKFLGINSFDLESELNNNGLNGLKLYIEDIDSDYGSKMHTLLTILQNENFDGFIESTHARMRMLDRIIFEDNNFNDKNIKGIKIRTTRAIKHLKEAITDAPYLKFTNYCTDKRLLSQNAKYGPRVHFTNGTKWGLNAKGQIHTIFYRD